MSEEYNEEYELDEEYSVKLTKTTNPKDVTDDEDKPVKATVKHYDVHRGGKKVGEVEHHHDDYSGHSFNATLHGKNVPYDRQKDGAQTAKAFIDGVAKTKWHAKTVKESLDEGKYDYPKSMTQTRTNSDAGTTNAAANRARRKAFRKKVKAAKHQELMKGKSSITEEEFDALSEEEQEMYELDEESIASATLRAGSRSDDNPKSKIDFMTKTLGAMNSMNKGDLTKWYDQAMALIGKEASSLPSGASADSNSSSIDMKGSKGPKTRDAMPKINVKEDVEEMFSGEELSEEFKDKASTLFEAAVHARAIVEIARLEEEYETRLEEEVTSILEGVESNLDTYLDYVVENWMKENEVAIESSLRNEIMEEFIGGLKNLFAEHYIEMPEEKIDVVEELAAKVERLETALDESINENSELKEIVLESHRQEVVGEIAEGLTMSQSEKFLSLAEGVDFDGDLDVYKKKLSVVKESYFPSSKPQTSYIEEETFEGDVGDKIVSHDPQVNRYVQAISRTTKK
jgi:AcrR family transcriptional regulator